MGPNEHNSTKPEVFACFPFMDIGDEATSTSGLVMLLGSGWLNSLRPLHLGHGPLGPPGCPALSKTMSRHWRHSGEALVAKMVGGTEAEVGRQLESGWTCAQLIPHLIARTCGPP